MQSYAAPMAALHTPAERRLWLAIGAFAAFGLALRIAAGQGALWLDEAWSAWYADATGTPLGVFLNINHDNNHHLNTLWLQLVGADAPPLVQRALSILTGTAAVFVAAMIARRQGAWPALLAALLFAVSPMLVTYGAEARGYAPMLLALLLVTLIVLQWLDAPSERPLHAGGIAIAVVLGMLAQLTMIFGLAAIAVAAGAGLLLRMPWRSALKQGLPLMLALFAPALGVIALVLGIGAAQDGFQFGNIDTFSPTAWAEGLAMLLRYAVGGPVPLAVAIALAVFAATRLKSLTSDVILFVTMAVAVPLGLLVLQFGNGGMPRYHLVGGIGLLMLAAVGGGTLFARRGVAHWIAAGCLVTITAGALIADRSIIENRRADPSLAIEAMQRRAPAGTAVAVERDRAFAVLEIAALQADYPLVIEEARCPAARFLFIDRDGNQPFPAQPQRCGVRFATVAESEAEGLSGSHWQLYQAIP